MQNPDNLRPVSDVSRTADDDASDRLDAAGEALVEQVERALPAHRPTLARRLRGRLVDEIDGLRWELHALGSDDELDAIASDPWQSSTPAIRSGAKAAFVADVVTWTINLTVVVIFLWEAWR